jgi:hypothetical protein
MIVFTGDWIKYSGKWRQVVSVDPTCDLFAINGVNIPEELLWFGTAVPEVFEGHVSDNEMQDKLAEAL